MKVEVLGAGMTGINTAWHLLARGHIVTVIEQQSGAAIETSFVSASQISVSCCKPWANRGALLKALKWMFKDSAPLLFRPQFDLHQRLWGEKVLAQCNDVGFERNVQQLVTLGAYSHTELKDIFTATGMEYNRLERSMRTITPTESRLTPHQTQPL